MKVLLKEHFSIKKKNKKTNILLRIHQTIKHTCSRVEFYILPLGEIKCFLLLFKDSLLN